MPSRPNWMLPPSWLVYGWPTRRISSGPLSSDVPSELWNRAITDVNGLPEPEQLGGAGSPARTSRVYDRYASWTAGHCGWNAKPSSPPSPAELTATLANGWTSASVVAVTGNVRIWPWRSTTYHRDASPGACTR